VPAKSCIVVKLRDFESVKHVRWAEFGDRAHTTVSAGSGRVLLWRRRAVFSIYHWSSWENRKIFDPARGHLSVQVGEASCRQTHRFGRC
jgi:hypothetical protein